eukprot:jgi/Ulvmu1/12879/UM098_0067.1
MGKHRGDKRHGEHRKSSHSDRKRSKKEHKHKKRRRESSTSDSEADYRLDSQSAPAAAEYVRCILRKFPTMKNELRDLVWQIDAGESPQLSNVDDPDLLRGLRGLFGALNLKRSKDTYSLKRGQDKILRRIGVVFNESIPDQSSERLRLPGDPVPRELRQALQSPSPNRIEHELSDTQRLEDNAGPDHVLSGETLPGQTIEEIPSARTVKFPAAVPQDLLQAAAQAAAAMRDEGLIGDIVFGLSAESVGPIPPADVLKEVEFVSRDVRAAEVMRVNALVARASDVGADAYEVLNIKETASAAEVRKRFWRVSLLVHPDKCCHEGAAAAFDAVKKAAEALMDGETRRGIDEHKQKEANSELDRQVAVELEKERHWRVVQGTATAEDARGPLDAQEVRDEWMTALPEKREPKPAYMKHASVTSFSHEGSSVAEVDVGWTALPGQAASEVRLLAGGAAAAAPTVQPMTVEDLIAAKNAQLMELVREQERESQQEQETRKSLLEKHQEGRNEEKAKRKQQRKDAKRDAAAGIKASVPAEPDWAGKNAWRPFDREKDLQAPGRSSGPAIAPTQSLAARFRHASS